MSLELLEVLVLFVGVSLSFAPFLRIGLDFELVSQVVGELELLVHW